MRIIAGKFKGRNLICPPEVRPVSFLVRKACFDILSNVISDSKVLDLFAGTGALGIEALSQGAKDVFFIDSDKQCLDAVSKNLRTMDINNANVYLKDSFLAVKSLFERKYTFDIIFIDPPYYQGMLIKILQLLEECDILAPLGFLVCFCYVKDEYLKTGRNFSLILQRKYGQTNLLIYRKVDQKQKAESQEPQAEAEK